MKRIPVIMIFLSLVLYGKAEGYLSDSIALLLCLRERFVWGGASGRCHFQYGAGDVYKRQRGNPPAPSIPLRKPTGI